MEFSIKPAAGAQPQTTNSQFQQDAPYCQAIPANRNLANTSHSLEQQPLQLREAEAMDTSTQNSDPAQLIEKLNQLHKKHKETPMPSLSQIQRYEKNQAEKSLAQCRKGPRREQLSRKHKQKVLQKKLDSINQRGQQHPWYKKYHTILMAYCQPELAKFIPSEILESLFDLLISKYSILKPSRRLLISRLRSIEELRKIIKNNPDLARGCLVNMDGVVFEKQSRIFSSDMCTAKKLGMEYESSAALCDYSGISFKKATFPYMIIRATFRNCNFSHADFTGSYITECDFHGADLTAACLEESCIISCDLHKSTLANIDFKEVGIIRYEQEKSRCLPKTIALLAQTILDYSNGSDHHLAARVLRMLADIFLTNDKPEKAEEVYDELLRRQQAEVDDFVNMGQYYMLAARALNEENHENKARLIEKAIARLQKGWRETSNNTGATINHDELFILAMKALSETDSAFNWRSVLEEIKNKAMGDPWVLLNMAQLFAVKQEDYEAPGILKQLMSNPEPYNKELLSDICQIISERGIHHEKFSTVALSLLQTVTCIIKGECITEEIDCENSGKHKYILACWLYRINALLHSGYSEEAYKVIFEMETAVPGTRQMLLENSYEDSPAWQRGGVIFKDLILRIRAAVAGIDLR